MKKFFLIMSHEYSQHVFRWRFLFSILSLPVLIAIAFLVIYLVTPRALPSLPVGIVDPSNYIATWSNDHNVATGMVLVFYATRVEANQALEDGLIQAFAEIPPGYPQSGEISLVSVEPMNSGDFARLSRLFRARMLQGYPVPVIRLLSQGSQLIVRDLQREHDNVSKDLGRLLLPTLAVFIFMLAIFSTSGYLMQSVTIEKENATMEMILTSVSHARLLTAKLCGIIAIGLTHLVIWFGFIIAVISFGQGSIDWPGSLQFSPLIVLVFIASLSLAFLMISAIMIAVGATVTQATEGQQITGPFSLPFIIPFLFTYQIMNDPYGSLATGLSLFPFTSPITLIIRLSVTQLPGWQVILSLGLQLITAIFLIWIAGRAFRVGMLQYSKRLSLKDILTIR